MTALLLIAVAGSCWLAWDVGYRRGERAANERWVRERVREEIERRRKVESEQMWWRRR